MVWIGSVLSVQGPQLCSAGVKHQVEDSSSLVFDRDLAPA
jgi:hypothetical protein